MLGDTFPPPNKELSSTGKVMFIPNLIPHLNDSPPLPKEMGILFYVMPNVG